LCIDHGSNNVPRPRSTDDGADDAEDVAVDEHATGDHTGQLSMPTDP
jgi:hypothetical protein